MLVKLDVPTASVFNVPDVGALAGRRVTIIDPDDVAIAEATAAPVGDNAIRLEERRDLPADERFHVRTDGVVQGVAVRLHAVEGRPEQAAFRQRVGDAWGWRCAVTGEDVREVLQAAHLPDASWRAGHNTEVDGILLRADLHLLLDAGLLRIEDDTVRVDAGSYRRFDGTTIRWPRGRAAER
jgi:hypothetical protein